jgi:hypothetical protein
MSYVGFGQEQQTQQQLIASMSGGQAATNAAVPRFFFLCQQVSAIRQAVNITTFYGEDADKAKVVAAKIDAFANKLKSWADNLPYKPLWKHLMAMSPVGWVTVGIAEILGKFPTEADKYGFEILNAIMAFEVEASQLCTEVQQVTGLQIQTFCKKLPDPVVVPKEESWLSGIGTIVMWGVIGIGAWWVGKTAYTAIKKHGQTIPKEKLPRYAGGSRKE